MQRFPALTSGDSHWHLPLNATSAGRLCEILLLDAAAPRRERLSELLAVDPALCLWTVCRAGRWGRARPESLADVAHRFDEQALSLLQWPVDGQEPAQAANERQRSRWQKLARASVSVGAQAAEFAEQDQAGAYLVGLLHNALEWLSSCGPRVSLTQGAGQSCLPDWLLAELRGLSGRQSTPSVVARAVREFRSGPKDSPPALPAALEEPMLECWDEPNAGTVPPTELLPDLARKLARLDKLEQAFTTTLEEEKLESLKQLAYGASHEINNPLANISTRAQTLLREETDPERRRKLSTINAQAFRAHEMIADMMLFARPPSMDPQPVDLVALARRVVTELAGDAEQQGTAISVTAPSAEVQVSADGTHLAVALKAICINALEAIGGGGSIELLVEQESESSGGASVIIRDSGPGIPSQVRRHLFDPFFSGREAGRGLGLGLSKAWRIVTEHGGRIDVAGDEQPGASFTIFLPAKTRAAGA